MPFTRTLPARLTVAFVASILFAVAAGDASQAASSNVTVSVDVATVTSIDVSGCASGTSNVTDFGFVVATSSAVTSADCSVTWGSNSSNSMLKTYQQDGTGAAIQGPAAIADFVPSTTDWVSGANMFGACLRAFSGANVAATWTVDGDASCTANNSDPWRRIQPTSASVGAKVAEATTSTTDATVKIRFGVRTASSQAVGSYSAPIVFEVVAPAAPDGNTSPTAPTYVSPADGSSTTVTTPTLQASFNDPNTGDTGRINFRLDDDVACATPLQTGTSTVTNLAIGATGSWTVGTALTPGTTYYWCVQGQDALAATSSWTVSRSFTVIAPVSLTWLTGFEHGTKSVNGGGLFQVASTTAAIDTTTARNGTKSLRFDMDPTASKGYVSSKAFGPTKIVVQRFALYIRTAPSTEVSINELCDAADTTCNGSLVLRADRTMKFCWQPTTTGCTAVSAALALNTWHVIEYRVDATTSTAWTGAWRINGAAQTAPANFNGGVFNFGLADMGINGGTNMVVDLNMDDWSISNTAADYPLGDGKVLGYLPQSTGVHTTPGNFASSITNGTAAWTALTTDSSLSPGSSQFLDDWPINTTASADLVRQTGAGTLNYGMQDTAEVNAPTGVIAIGGHREAAAGANQISVGGMSGVTPLTGGYSASPTNGTTAGFYWSGMLAMPGGWTTTNFNAMSLTLGATTTTVAPWTDALMLEAEFPP